MSIFETSFYPPKSKHYKRMFAFREVKMKKEQKGDYIFWINDKGIIIAVESIKERTVIYL